MQHELNTPYMRVATSHGGCQARLLLLAPSPALETAASWSLASTATRLMPSLYLRSSISCLSKLTWYCPSIVLFPPFAVTDPAVTPHATLPASKSSWVSTGLTTVHVVVACTVGSMTKLWLRGRVMLTGLQEPSVAPPVRLMAPMLMRTLLLATLIVSAAGHVKVLPVCSNRNSNTQQEAQATRVSTHLAETFNTWQQTSMLPKYVERLPLLSLSLHVQACLGSQADHGMLHLNSLIYLQSLVRVLGRPPGR